MRHRFKLSFAALALSLGPAQRAVAQTGNDYVDLVDRRREFTNFNVETTRGLLLSSGKIYALNTHASHVIVDQNFDGVFDTAYQTLNQPIAFDLWSDGTQTKLVVAGGATYGLIVQNAGTGKPFGVVNLPSEPGDVVVHDALDKAYVSCMGTHEVVEVDLNNFAITARYPLPTRRPCFLNLEVDPTDSAEYEVFVTALASGNNTTTKNPAETKGSIVLALAVDDPATQALEGLPDEDLFALRFSQGGVQIDTVARGVGGIVLDHGRNPVDGRYWVLSVVPDNGDPAKQDEPSLEHDFVTNTATILPDTTTERHVALDPTVQVIDLDVAGAPCSFPYALQFSSSGDVAIAGSTSDRIGFYDKDGVWLADAQLPDGSIPRDFQILEVGSARLLMVYCWGSNKIEIIDLNGDLDQSWFTMDLGLDPTPPGIAEGRRIWYDGDRSAEGRTTCNSCHPGGGSDFIGWQLQDPLLDRKDVMVTQSLRSIEDTFPYHWRGERDLGDFNLLAFPGLLGGPALDTTPGGEFDAFRDFVFSLQAPRNPMQEMERVLEGDAVAGQASFLNDPTLGSQSCADCHALPHGSNGDISFDGRETRITTNFNMDVSHLRQLFNKSADTVTTVVDGQSKTLSRFGFGLAHEGEFHDIFDFVGAPVFTVTAQQQTDIAAFVEQMDQGIAPAAQAAWFLYPNGSNDADIGLLLDQAATPDYLDAVVIGRIRDKNGLEQEVSWLYDAAAQLFFADIPTLELFASSTPGQATLADLQAKANSGATLVFMGVPPGNGRGFALDLDRDGLLNGEEAAFGLSQYDGDWDDDGQPDGYEVTYSSDPKDAGSLASEGIVPSVVGAPAIDYVSGSSAQVQVRFSEQVTYVVDYYRTDDPANVFQVRRQDLVAEDTFVLQGLVPSSAAGVLGGNPGVAVDYEYTITPTDLSGNSATYGPFSLGSTTDGIEIGGSGATRRLRVADLTQAPNGPAVDVSVRVRPIHEDLAGDVTNQLAQSPQLDRVAVFHVLKEVGGELVPTTSGDFTVDPGTRIANDYLLTGAPSPLIDVYDGLLVFSSGTVEDLSLGFRDGVATLSLQASPGVVLRLQLVGLFTEVVPVTVPPTFVGLDSNAWMMPSTPDDPIDRRGITIGF